MARQAVYRVCFKQLFHNFRLQSACRSGVLHAGIVLTTAMWRVTEMTISVYLYCLRFSQTIFLAISHCGHCLFLGLAVFEALQVFVEPVH